MSVYGMASGGTPHRIGNLTIDIRFMCKSPRFPGKESAERETCGIYQQQPDPVRHGRQNADKSLDADMTALALNKRGRHEGRTDEEEHGRLILPIGWCVEQTPRRHAVAENRASEDQRHRRQDDDDTVQNRKHTICPRHERVARGGG